MKISIRSIALTLLLALGMASCKSDTTGPSNGGNNNGTAVAAKKGSSYFFHLKHEDQSGATVLSDTNVYRITEDNLSVFGRNGVRQLELTTEGVDQGLIAYLSYNSDNSASIFFPAAALFGGLSEDPWIRLPLSSSGNSQIVVADTSIEFFGAIMHIKIDVSTTYLLSETLKVGTTDYSARKLKVITTTTTTTDGVPDVEVDETTMWWIPEIGFLGKTEEDLIDDQDREVLSTEMLARFSLVK